MSTTQIVFMITVHAFVGACGCGSGTGNDEDASRSGFAACPAPPPQGGSGLQPGDSCLEEGLTCSYGNTPGICGKEVATCKGGKFQFGVYACLRPECPATAPATPDPCSVVQPASACVYPDGTRCACAPVSLQSWHWLCDPPPADLRCPRQMPQLGGACAVEDLDCDYHPDGWHMRCQRGLWRQSR